jgi:capsular polysaccharide biosynthesis protein
VSDYQMPPKEVNLSQPVESDEETIDLLELLYALLGKWREIAAATVACALIAAIGVLFFVTPKYQASSTIYVISRKDSAINISDLQIGTALTDDYIQVFHMWEVQEKVISNLDLPYTYNQLDGMLSVTNASNTRMLEITVTSESAQEAADIANEYATVVRDYIAKKMATDKPSIMSTALVPTVPVSPNKTKSILLGALLGFVVSAGVIVVMTLLDDTYKTADDIKKYTGLVTMAVIPLEKSDEPKHQRADKQIGLKLPGGKTL